MLAQHMEQSYIRVKMLSSRVPISQMTFWGVIPIPNIVVPFVFRLVAQEWQCAENRNYRYDYYYQRFFHGGGYEWLVLSLSSKPHREMSSRCSSRPSQLLRSVSTNIFWSWMRSVYVIAIIILRRLVPKRLRMMLF